MKQRSLMVLLLTILGLTGCFPDASTYYRPMMDGAEAGPGICQAKKSHIYFWVGAVPFHAVAQEGVNGVVSVMVGQPAPVQRKGMEAESWQYFNFAAGNFTVRDPDSGNSLGDIVVQVFRDDRSESVQEPFMRRNGRESFDLMIDLPAGSPERFELLSPALIVDGQEIPFPVLRFEKGVWVGLSPLNC